MLNQIRELIGITNRYTNIVELWLDAGWEKKRERWPIAEIYKTVKEMAPQCQVGLNWSIGRTYNTTPNSYLLLQSIKKNHKCTEKRSKNNKR
jgi:alpha-L-fucosidase